MRGTGSEGALFPLCSHRRSQFVSRPFSTEAAEKERVKRGERGSSGVVHGGRKGGRERGWVEGRKGEKM
jgi:hypothetical protein